MLAAMKNGKHTATEVPAAMTVDDCWAMVEAAEKHQKHCVMMENCNYDRMEMMVFNMVRQGLFGEILHAEGGYLHDLRDDQVRRRRAKGCGAAPGRRSSTATSIRRTASGPIANCLDINRGDRFDYLVSMSGPSRGLQDWAAEHVPADSPKRQERYVLGDVNVSLIKTARGRTIVVAALHQPAAARTAASTWSRARRGCSRAIRTASTSKDAASDDQWQEAQRAARRVRASALEGDRRARAGRRPRRHGLHRGLPADQVPARGHSRPT